MRMRGVLKGGKMASSREVKKLVENIGNWDNGGSIEAKELCISLISSGDNDELDLKFRRCLYEICRNSIIGGLPASSSATFLRELSESHDVVASVLIDILAVLDVEVGTAEDKTHRPNFIMLLTECAKFIPDSTLKVHLDAETLSSLSLISSQKVFDQRCIKVKTRLFYRQDKFNLLREESEGYSKLAVELGQELDGGLTSAELLERVMALIGHFSLDPNRVMDVLLEAVECHSQKKQLLLLPVLRSCNGTTGTLCQLLGFKFQQYAESSVATPLSLFRTAALLLHTDLVTVEELYSHLSPVDDNILKQHKEVLQKGRHGARKTTIAVTSSKEDDSNDVVITEQPEDNQKVGVVRALLELGDWQRPEWILLRLPPFVATGDASVAKALCQLVHAVIEPVYRPLAPKPARGRRLTIKLPANKESAQNRNTVYQAQSVQDLKTFAFPMLTQLGLHLSTDPVLLAKMLRIGRDYVQKHWNPSPTAEQFPSDPLCLAWLDCLDEVLLPSLSLLPCNCSMAEETWSLLKCLPYQVRYRLYGQWKNTSYLSDIVILQARATTMERARYVMKRLTKESVKQSGRQLGKLSHSNPGIVFEYVLSQIQTYDNFIGPVVDSLKYLTPLAYDVLSYCLIEALGNPDKEKLKQEDTNLSQWLQGLAQFSGTVFRKYTIELTGLLQYVANQLKSGKSFDLLVLKEVVVKMSGIELMEEVTQPQLQALAGGEMLRAEGGYFNQVRNTKKSSQRLREALMDSALGVPLCVLIAQQRQSVIFVEATSCHLKLLGKLYDQCQDTLVQFGGFLATSLLPQDYSSKFPQFDDLVCKYFLQVDTAFFLERPRVIGNINARVEGQRRAGKAGPDAGKTEKDLVEAEMKSLIDRVRPLNICKEISCHLFTTFWSLSLYDVWVPEARYQEEIGRQEQALQELDSNAEMNASKRKKEKDRCDTMMKRLGEEMARQKEQNQRIMNWLEPASKTWFKNVASAKSKMATQFFQQCAFPRCCFSAIDAVYCAKFVQIMHQLKTPHFSTLLFYDRVFADQSVSLAVASCTENEASRYGRFLCCLLEEISEWHKSEESYEKHCHTFPGFISAVRSDGVVQLDYKDFRHICFKWHYKMTKAMLACLESKDYNQIRNAILVLIKILPHFPVVLSLGTALEKRIDILREAEKGAREDLSALANSYLGKLRHRKATFIPEAQFHNKEDRDKKSQENDPKKPSATESDSAGVDKSRLSAPGSSDAATTKPQSNSIASSGSPEHASPSSSTAVVSSLSSRPSSSLAAPSLGSSTTSSAPRSANAQAKAAPGSSSSLRPSPSSIGHERSKDSKSESKTRDSKTSSAVPSSKAASSQSPTHRDRGERQDASPSSSAAKKTKQPSSREDEKDAKRRKTEKDESAADAADRKKDRERERSGDREKADERSKSERKRDRDESVDVERDGKRHRSDEASKNHGGSSAGDDRHDKRRADKSDDRHKTTDGDKRVSDKLDDKLKSSSSSGRSARSPAAPTSTNGASTSSSSVSDSKVRSSSAVSSKKDDRKENKEKEKEREKEREKHKMQRSRHS